MSKKRILTFFNIFLSIVLIGAVFLPITDKSLFDYSTSIARFIVILLSVMSIVVNAINKKVELTLITAGYTFFYVLDFGWGTYDRLNIGFYILLVVSFIMLLLTIFYDLFQDSPNKQASQVTTNINQNIKPNYANINKYPNVQVSQHMNGPYQNQNVYPPQGYNNYRR
jgi:hypothetical protein